MNEIKLGKQEVIHFVGIGGIGMSGLAQIMKTMGFNIQGSDVNKNKNTENCKKLGIKILKGHIKKNINNVTIVVKSSAIKSNNVELLAAKRSNIPIYDRIEMLANVIDLKKKYYNHWFSWQNNNHISCSKDYFNSKIRSNYY
jgi:UDP-N-acetylmuramate--alanine ligase